jgi:hypothetical protein
MRIKSFKLFVESLIFDKYEIDKLADLILSKQEELASNLMRAGLEDSEVLFEELADSIIQKRLIDKVTNYNEIPKFDPKFHFHHTYFGKILKFLILSKFSAKLVNSMKLNQTSNTVYL